MSELDQIGPRLRAARKARAVTLKELARRTAMSASTLSRLESGKRQASLELLLPLTRALGIRLDDLIPDEPRDPRVRRASFERDGMRVTPLMPESAPVRTFEVVYRPTDQPPAQKTHDGYEWLYVLAGRLRLRLGEQDLTLSRGEAAEFDTRTPHSMSAAGGRPARVLNIFNADGARMHTYTDRLP